MCPLVLTLSLSVGLPLPQFSMQSDLCVSPACSLSYTPGFWALRNNNAKALPEATKGRELIFFPLFQVNRSLSSNSYKVEKKMWEFAAEAVKFV